MNPTLSSLLADAWPGIATGAIAIALLPWLDRSNTLHRMVVCSIAIMLMWRYMAWRIFGSLPEVGFSINYVTGVAFAGVEMLSMLSTTLSIFFLIRTRNRTPDVLSNLVWFEQQPPPLVDVLICTYNEDRVVLEQTIVGALSLNYPN